MYFPDVNHIIASWQGKHVLHAVKEAEGTVFCLECKGVEASLYRPIREVRGWVSPDSIQEKKRAQFYQMLRPLFNSDQSSVVFALFIKKIYGEVRGKVVGILENKKISIEFFPKEGPSFPIQQIEGLTVPRCNNVVNLSSSWLWVKEHIDACCDVTLSDSSLYFGSITSHIAITSLTGKTVIIEAEMHDLVKDLKEKFQKIEGIPIIHQNWINSGRQLENERTLADYRIRSGSEVHLVLRLAGGGMNLTDFNNMQSEIMLDLVPASGPVWTRIRPGLNLEGKCNNETCEANGQTISIWKGFGIFNMSKECEISTCPECKEIAIDVNNCGFLRCIYSIEGVTQHGEKRTRLDVRAPDDKFLTYDSGGATQKWRTLTITTKPIPVASSPLELTSIDLSPPSDESSSSEENICTLF